MKQPIFRNMVWAVDTTEPAEFYRNAQLAIQTVTIDATADVYPVHVLSYPFATSEANSDFEQAYLALSEKRLKELVQESQIPHLRSGTVLISKKKSVRGSVEALLEFAKGKGVDSIVASTHSRGAMSKLIMGSFAETLLLRSSIPVLTVNPQARVKERIAKVLFPTPFTTSFRPAFEIVLKLCESLNASLTVIYKEPIIPMIEASYELAEYLEQDAVERELEVKVWREKALAFATQVEFRVDTKPGNIPDEIISFAAKNNFDLVVLVSETVEAEGPRASSACRKVVRDVPCPVLTLKTS